MKLVISKTATAFMAFIIALAVLLPVFTVNTYAVDQDYVKSGTASIVMYCEDLDILIDNGDKWTFDTLLMPLGTGFFIGKGNAPQYIVTSDQLIDIYDTLSVLFKSGDEDTIIKYSTIELRAYFSEDNYSALDVVCRGSKESNSIDAAVLSLKSPIEQAHPLKISPAPEKDGEEITVYAAGYTESQSYSDIDEYMALIFANRRSNLSGFSVHKGTMDTGSFETDSMLPAVGCCGGPIVNEKGEVVGVNGNLGFDKYDFDTELISSIDIINFLDNNNIPYAKAGNNAVGIIIIVICVIVVAAAVIALIYLKSKGVFSGSAPKPQSESKKSASAASAPAVAPAAAQPQMFVRSMSAQHNGKTFPIGTEPLLIGRDPLKCTIVYQEGTQGVSAVHCSISYDSATNTFILTDLGSTYGTYLIGGQRVLEKTSLRLRSGDSFYVGDKSNVCRVEVMGR